MDVWAAIMLLAGGMFAGGGASFAWSRVPIWRRMPVPQFVSDFEQTLSWTDKVQPAFLIVAIIGSAGYAVTSDGISRLLAILAAIGFAGTLGGSVGYMVPLQRKIITTPAGESETIEEMRLRWFQGNLGRSILSIAAFLLAVLAGTIAR